MNKNFYAILIGFDEFTDQAYLPKLEYAQKDATDFYEVLTDPKYGNLSKENVHLITGNRTKDDVETELYVHAVKERNADDTVLIYYSGHGFIASDTPESYLATPDTNIAKINKNPNAGLRMEYLREKIFLPKSKNRPKNVIFFLDCCYSGAFCPEIKGGGSQRIKALVEAHDFDGDGRVAFVSSPAEVVSREDKKLKNGIFTNYILLGLRGEAIEKNTGDVTFTSLVSYVQSMSPQTQPPIFYGKSGRIVLASPKTNELSPIFEKNILQEKKNFKKPVVISKSQDLIPLANPIEKQVECIDNLIGELTKLENRPTEKTALGNQILNSIRESLGAEFAFVEQLIMVDNPRHKFLSDSPVVGSSSMEGADEILGQIYPWLAEEKSKLLPSRFGFRFDIEGSKSGNSHSIAIPLRLEYPREYLIITGIKQNFLEYGEILGHSLLSLYNATLSFSSLDVRRVENFLLDELKRSFGQIPYNIYKKRFAKFQEHLSRIVFFYEPVVALGKKVIEVDSWEALARDPEAKAAPKDLFDAAQLWGPEFITELDLHCLRTATKDFSEKWKAERGKEKMDPLAVNVYPETLYRKNYIKELHRIVKEDEIIKGKRLVLEISEKLPISWVDRMSSEYIDNPLDVFADHIQSLSKTLGISFAIDDFGVGHSSAERLAKLELDHVKIDRDVLYHPHPQHTIQYVMDIVQSSHAHPIKVVMEGFDGGSEISLSELHNDLKILYVQGHLIRKASPTVADLDDEIKKDLIDRLSFNTK